MRIRSMPISIRLAVWSLLVVVIGLSGCSRNGEVGQESSGVSALTGGWGAHGAGLEITNDGRGVLEWRLDRPCRIYSAPCDKEIGSRMVEGGRAQIRHIRSRDGGFVGVVTSSTYQHDVPLGTVVMVSQEYENPDGTTRPGLIYHGAHGFGEHFYRL